MKYRMIAIFVMIFIASVIATACTSAGSTPTTTPSSTSALDGATLVQERCSVCHPLSRVTQSRFTAEQWKLVVDQMIARGAELTPEEEIVVVNYLAANYGP